MSTTLAIPEPNSLVAVDGTCEAIEAWAETCESVPELRDAGNKLAAIDEYLNRTSTEGRSRVAAAMRRIEARIGALMPALTPQEAGAVRGGHRDDHLHKQQIHDFRRMAEHPEVVEEVIAESTDQSPPSRRKVMERIAEAKGKHPIPAQPRNLPAEERADQIRPLAAKGMIAAQISAEIGVSEDRVRELARQFDIPLYDLTAARGSLKSIDPNRVVDVTVTDLEHSVSGLLDRIAGRYDELDRDQLDRWANSLSESIRSLTTLKNNIKKELARD